MRWNRLMNKLLGPAVGCTAILLTAGHSAANTLTVSFEPALTNVKVGETVLVNLVVDGIDAFDTFTFTGGLVGWGMNDVSFDNTIVSLTQTTLGASWNAAPAAPLGGLTANLFAPPEGDDVILATFEFTAVQIGTTDLIASMNLTDPGQGFVGSGGALYDVVFDDGQINVTVIPLPAPVVMGLAGLAGVVVLRRRYQA